jgi:hypothetical protein
MRVESTPMSAQWIHYGRALVARVALVLAGCGEMKFVNQSAQAGTDEEDGRADIRLTGVVADLTTSGVVQNRVHADLTTYSQTRNLLFLSQVKVEGYGKDGKLQGLTTAGRGAVYMADIPSANRHNGDLEFAGGVVHRVPDAKDPTTDAVSLKTDRLLWRNLEQHFVCTRFFRNELRQPGKRPMSMIGDGFVVTKDLRRWNVKYGSVTTEQDEDVRGKSARLSKELEERASGSELIEARQPKRVDVEVPAELLAREDELRRPVQDRDLKVPAAPAPEARPAATPTPAAAPSYSIQGGRKIWRLPQSRPAPSSSSATHHATPGATGAQP